MDRAALTAMYLTLGIVSLGVAVWVEQDGLLTAAMLLLVALGMMATAMDTAFPMDGDDEIP